MDSPNTFDNLIRGATTLAVYGVDSYECKG